MQGRDHLFGGSLPVAQVVESTPSSSVTYSEERANNGSTSRHPGWNCLNLGTSSVPVSMLSMVWFGFTPSLTGCHRHCLIRGAVVRAFVSSLTACKHHLIGLSLPWQTCHLRQACRKHLHTRVMSHKPCATASYRHPAPYLKPLKKSHMTSSKPPNQIKAPPSSSMSMRWRERALCTRYPP